MPAGAIQRIFQQPAKVPFIRFSFTLRTDSAILYLEPAATTSVPLLRQQPRRRYFQGEIMQAYDVKLIKKQLVARDTMEFFVERPKGFDFRAGQFCDITLYNPPETDEKGNKRGFSIVSTPDDDYVAVATRLRDTAYKRAARNLPEGTVVKLEGVWGDFTLHRTETTPAVFLVGGIGVTPVLSMVTKATHDKTRHQITLLHANKTHEDAPFTADFETLAKKNVNFTFVPVCSDSAPANFRGERGRIDAAMIKRHVADLSAPIYYLAGPEGMVKAMRKLLVDELKINEDNIRTEEFSGY
jgi:ferredoxin-NADP reductase